MNLNTAAPSQAENLAQSYDQARALLREALKISGRIYLNHSTENDHFHQLSEDEQAEVIYKMNQWSQIVIEFAQLGKKTSDTKNLARYYLRQMGIRVDDSFFDKIETGDILEIYGTDSKRLFFNPELFDYSSYSPDEMFSTPYWILYRRDDFLNESLHKITQDVFTGVKTQPFKPDVPRHIAHERHSERKYVAEIEHVSIAPFYLGEIIGGLVSIERFKLI